MKVSELEGVQLDWAVAKALGLTGMFCLEDGKPICCVEDCDFEGLEDWVGDGWAFVPSTYWAMGGPIIEKEGIGIERFGAGEWSAVHGAVFADEVSVGRHGSGPTALIAAMRALVSSKLGPEIELPA